MSNAYPFRWACAAATARMHTSCTATRGCPSRQDPFVRRYIVLHKSPALGEHPGKLGEFNNRSLPGATSTSACRHHLASAQASDARQRCRQ